LLIAGRILQAIGACTALVCARAIIRDSTTPEEGARTLAKAGALMTAAPLLGPLAGGFLEAQFNWRAAFVLLSVLGGLALWMVSTQIIETNRFKDAQALRAGRLTATYRQIAAHPGFWAYTLTISSSYGGLVAYLSGSSQVLQTVLGLSPQAYGFGFAVCTLGYLLGTLLCRRWLKQVGLQRTLRRGAVLAVCGGGMLVGFAILGVHHWAAIFGPQALYLVAHGVAQPCAQAGSVAYFPRQAGSAAALMGFVMMMFAAMLVFWIGASFNATVYPLVFTVFSSALALFAAVFFLVRRYGALPR
jgi:DHA1 family bicyclomycin/chloramphenicol resistance-like MFS transporter